jgi:hypothetical protein
MRRDGVHLLARNLIPALLRSVFELTSHASQGPLALICRDHLHDAVYQDIDIYCNTHLCI